MFTTEGGVDVGDVDSKASRLEVAVDQRPTLTNIKSALLKNVPSANQP